MQTRTRNRRDIGSKTRRTRNRRPRYLETLERRDLLTTLAWSNGPALPAPRTDAVALVTADNANPQGIADPQDASLLPDHHAWTPVSVDAGVVSAHWDNPENRLDVSDDGQLTPLDALLIINHLNDHGETDAARFDDNVPYLDPTADGHVTPLDVLTVVNALNEPAGSAEPMALDLAVAQWSDADLSSLSLDAAINDLVADQD